MVNPVRWWSIVTIKHQAGATHVQIARIIVSLNIRITEY